MEEGVDPKFLETQRRLQEEARERNRSEFGEEGEAARLRLEGFRAGLYVRLVLKKVPVEFVKVRTARYVIVVAIVVIVISAFGTHQQKKFYIQICYHFFLTEIYEIRSKYEAFIVYQVYRTHPI